MKLIPIPYTRRLYHDNSILMTLFPGPGFSLKKVIRLLGVAQCSYTLYISEVGKESDIYSPNPAISGNRRSCPLFTRRYSPTVNLPVPSRLLPHKNTK